MTAQTDQDHTDNPFTAAGENIPDDAVSEIDRPEPKANGPKRSATVIHIADRLPVTSFFGAPPRTSLYHTQRAAGARQRAEEDVPAELAQARAVLTAAGLRRADARYPDAADHNAATLAYALAYVGAGLHVIDSHAIDPRTGEGTGPQNSAKLPRGHAWQKRATDDAAEVVLFWTGDGEYPADKKGKRYAYAPPHAPRNVSIVLPEGCGLFVLDIDGDEGKANLAALIEANGELPRTPQSVSGSGGLHFIFRTSRPIRNTASQIETGVDIRGEGGQIIAAPSIHKTGNFYQWAEGCAPWECDIADAPGWLEELAFTASKKNANAAPKARRARVSGKVNRKPRHAATGGGFEHWCDRIGDHADGFDSVINSAACAWWRENPEGDADALKEQLRDVILAAPCDDDRAESRYSTDEYLDDRIENARQFVEDNPDDEEESTDESRFEPRKNWLPAGYKIKGGTVYRLGDADEDEGDKPLCQAFDVVGSAANLAGNGDAGVIIHFQNRFAVSVEVTLSLRDLTSPTGGGVVEDLAGLGMRIIARSKKDRDSLLDLFCRMTPRRHSPTVPRPGWVRDGGGNVLGFMLPSGQYIEAEPSNPFRLATVATMKDTGTAGNLEGWQKAANAALAHDGNFYWGWGVCAAFVGPLLSLTDLPACGFNLSGDSSMGKTLALLMGCAAWGATASKRGTFFKLNSTLNAMEDLASVGSETFMGLDEISMMQNPKALAEMLFALAEGTGKSRKAGRGRGLAEDAEYRPFIGLTNERTLRTVIENAGGDYKTGISVRFPDISVGDGARVSVAEIKVLEDVTRNYGHAGPAFIRWLIAEGWHHRGHELRKAVDEAAATLAGDASPAQARAARIFALVQIAGEKACEAGLLNDAAKVRGAVLAAWNAFKTSEEGKATEGESSMLDGFRAWLVRAFDVNVMDVTDDSARSYRDRKGWYDEDKIVLIADAFNDMKAMGLNGTRAALLKALEDAGALEMSGKNRVHNKLPKGIGAGDVPNVRIYRDKLGLPHIPKGAVVTL
jgi:hypothetical protein